MYGYYRGLPGVSQVAAILADGAVCHTETTSNDLITRRIERWELRQEALYNHFGEVY